MDKLKEKSKNGVITPDYSESPSINYVTKKHISTAKKVAITLGSILGIIIVAY